MGRIYAAPTKMIFTLLVTASPNKSLTAYEFSKAILNKNHHINKIFFHQDGIYHADTTNNSYTLWQTIAKQYPLDLAVCVGSATQREILDEFHNKTKKLADGFKITGLAELMEAMIHSERLITFN